MLLTQVFNCMDFVFKVVTFRVIFKMGKESLMSEHINNFGIEVQSLCLNESLLEYHSCIVGLHFCNVMQSVFGFGLTSGMGIHKAIQ